MLLGTGVDIIRIARIRQSWQRFGDRFLQRVFTAAEREACARKPQPAASYAVRFAAKEAAFKALGGTQRPAWRELEILAEPGGRPCLRLYGRTAALHGHVRTAVSLAHDGEYAIASVTAECDSPRADGDVDARK